MMLEIDSPDKELPRRDGLRGISSTLGIPKETGGWERCAPAFRGLGHRPAEPAMPSLFEREMRSKTDTERD